MLTKQEVFDKVVARLRDGTGRAVDDYGRCCYLTDEGLRCAVGIFIPKNHPCITEGGNVYSIITNYPKNGDCDDPLPSEIYAFPKLMSRLQNAHDLAFNWNDYKFNTDGEKELKIIARQFRLKYTEPTGTVPHRKKPSKNKSL